MAITTDELGGINTLSALVEKIEARSAFMAASPQQPISLGVKNTLITSASVNLSVVAEGGKKPVGGSLNTVVLETEKIAGILVNTTEVLANVDVGDILEKTAPAQIARRFDAAVVSGEIGNLSAADVAEIAEWTDLHAAFAAVNATGIVASSAFVAQLLGFRNAAGIEYLPQSGKVDQVLGVPVHTFRSATPVAWVGDFEAHARWGAASPAGGLVEKFTQGVVNDGETAHNLIDENKVAYRVEGYFAHGANLSEFRKLELATDTDTEG